MKLLVMHLSDIHFRDSNNYSFANITSLTNALRPSISDIGAILIVISGDLTFSGNRSQFIEIGQFLKKLRKRIKLVYGIETIEIAIVPGNHDVDYTNNKLKREDLEVIHKDNSYDKFVDKELEKQEQFLFCARLFGCFQSESLVSQKHISIGDKHILINLINTAAFSSLDEDQGFHYLSEEDLLSLEQQENADFVFTVMHHPHVWFNWRVVDRLEAALYKNTDLIFVGHKHYESTRTIKEDQNSVNILAGGMLSNCGNWNSSVFYIGVLDLDSRHFVTHKYQMDVAEKIYIEKSMQDLLLSKDRKNALGFSVLDKYLVDEIDKDPFLISENLQDYFVFPLLEEQRDEKKEGPTHDIDNMKSFLTKLESSKKVLVSGLIDSGKSVLTKAVFNELRHQRMVLLIHGNEVTNNPERTIRNSFDEIYGRDQAKYERFRQSDPISLVLIIDDVDEINTAYRDDFIDYVNPRFGIILETCQQDIELDIQTRLRKKHDRKEYAVFRIEPFYKNKRLELVTKIINIIGNQPQKKEEIIYLLCDALSKQKTLYNWSPSFIVKFTKYYYNNIGESSQNDGNVFSKVFENNLISLIRPYATKEITVDKILMVLDKIAYGIYKSKEYPITTKRVCDIVDAYNDRYDSTVNAVHLLNVLVSARVIKETDIGYLFYERSYLAYFTAREISRLIQASQYEDIQHVMRYSYMNINADILLFVTYITDNLNIIRMLMDMAEQAVEAWEEYSLSPVNIEYMREPAHLIIQPVEEGDREKEEQKHIETEQAEAKSLSLANDASIFDGESEELSFIQEMLRSTSLMTTLSRALPSFEHMMEKEDKERCVFLIYSMPLRIFYAWAHEVDGVRSELVQMIKDFHEWEYRKDKPNVEPLSDHKALMALRWESTSLLLELMNAAFGYATKENTWRFIDQYNYDSASIYGIEHLMSIEKRDIVELFIQEANRIYKNSEKEQQTKELIQRVARHYMVTSKRIQFSEIQQMNSKLFGEELNRAQLLMEQGKNKKKE